jgi:hypothetical protein
MWLWMGMRILRRLWMFGSGGGGGEVPNLLEYFAWVVERVMQDNAWTVTSELIACGTLM